MKKSSVYQTIQKRIQELLIEREQIKEYLETYSEDQILEHINENLPSDIKAYTEKDLYVLDYQGRQVLDYEKEQYVYSFKLQYQNIEDLINQVQKIEKEIELKRQLQPKTKIWILIIDFEETLYFLSKESAENYRRKYTLQHNINEYSLNITEAWINA